MPDLDRPAKNTLTAFTEVCRSAFMGDPATDPRLAVEVLGARLAADTPMLVVVTPWTMNGLVFPPDDTFPDELTIAGRRRSVYVTELAPLGRCRSVDLVADVSRLAGPEPARPHARPVSGRAACVHKIPGTAQGCVSGRSSTGSRVIRERAARSSVRPESARGRERMHGRVRRSVSCPRRLR
ncbi:[NiFe]-hydrogenase assembly chaperone HybE [Streptomyces europaeiscabiei]|uniref:[NiFe]-hydrogenase assembly chaperone HybE n=1 Tax=Streptomyces europaeiscabiei TaxID=146819 RepID=UPI002E14F2F1|nr:[NiFe]-hydrogenase assembly chaperone HybE [Streptomyces europaeiscabiei]